MDLDDINACWGWTGMEAVEVIAENDFGNLLLRDEDGAYWWLCPQLLLCECVAHDDDSFAALSYDQAFLADWYACELTSIARAALGPLSPHRKYCMTVPMAFGGDVEPHNLAIVPLSALIRFTGEVAEAIDGARS